MKVPSFIFIFFKKGGCHKKNRKLIQKNQTCQCDSHNIKKKIAIQHCGFNAGIAVALFSSQIQTLWNAFHNICIGGFSPNSQRRWHNIWGLICSQRKAQKQTNIDNKIKKSPSKLSLQQDRNSSCMVYSSLKLPDSINY